MRLASVLLLLCAAPAAWAQTDPHIILDPWATDGTWGATHDDLLFQGEAHMKNEDGAKAQIFFWDSIGRFRLGADGPVLGYRYVTMAFDTNSSVLPDHFDEVSVAAGMKLGTLAGGDLWASAGIGYSGDNPFADSEGVFALAHLLWHRRLNDTDGLALSLDYNGVSPLFPDVPLPGVEYFHRDGNFSIELGFPRCALAWAPTDALSFEASYQVPYTADVVADYKLASRVSVFGRYSNFYNGFRQDDEPTTDRMFVQMSRAEVGLRYVNPHLFFEWAYFDAALAVGYAFEQHVSGGFDARNQHALDEVSDVPYVGLVLRGKF